MIRLAFAFVLSACSVDPTEHPDYCVVDTDCPDGRMCVDNYCVRACVANEPCFDADQALLLNGGICRAGICNAALGYCQDQTLPRGEVCNELDDDCDGNVDEIGGSCFTGDKGLCGDGLMQCADGGGTCVAQYTAMDETCDNEDEDCDGATDEGTETTCYPAPDGCVEGGDGYECQGVCRPGVRACVGGMPSDNCAEAIVPTTEVCTAPGGVSADEDCDTQIDEECACTMGAMQDCYRGPGGTLGIGECAAGSQVCNVMREGMYYWSPCADDVVPEPEACDNPDEDNDCNTVMDDIEGLGEDCTVSGTSGICAAGTGTCTGTTFACVGPSPEPTDPCDGLDNDCDGTADQDFDTRTDRMNCGMCGRACAADCCAGGCTDVRTDESNCGACGAPACAEGLLCCAGTCADPASSACEGCAENCEAMGETCCSGVCFDLQNDDDNCGRCGNSCSDSQVCCGGVCVTSNEDHCGDTCSPCADGSLCCDGSCWEPSPYRCTSCDACPMGLRDCCPDTDGCVDLDSDPMNCGMCGRRCGSSETCCSGTCVNTATNVMHCGGCGRHCRVLGLPVLCACAGSACSLGCGV